MKGNWEKRKKKKKKMELGLEKEGKRVGLKRMRLGFGFWFWFRFGDFGIPLFFSVCFLSFSMCFRRFLSLPIFFLQPKPTWPQRRRFQPTFLFCT